MHKFVDISFFFFGGWGGGVRRGGGFLSKNIFFSALVNGMRVANFLKRNYANIQSRMGLDIVMT